MVKQTTETGRTLIPESNYHAMITAVKKKTVKEFIIYAWSFEALVNDSPFYFTIDLFSSQMGDLLRALKAKEVTPNRFEWDDETVVGNTLSFNIVHVVDKKGIMREQISDISLLTVVPNNNPNKVSNPQDIAWND